MRVRTELPVLMYHSVSAASLPDLAVPADLLREQLAALADAGYALLGLTEAVARRRLDPAAAMVAVTFDDGFLDFLTRGLEVLDSTGASATLYMAAGHAGRTASWLGRHAAEFGPLLTWSQLREVAGAGIEIGNHAWHHRPLDVLPRRVLERDVRISAEVLRSETGAAVTSFAYPHGYHGARVRAAVARHGHRTACEVGRRRFRPGRDRMHAIPRLQPTARHSGADVVALVEAAWPGIEPALKRAAQPGWRLVRRVARDGFNLEVR